MSVELLSALSSVIMYMYSCLLLVASLGFLCEAASLRYVTIETALGKLRGKVVVKDEGTVTQFLGVPYSKPPVGERRFALPQPLELWTGVKDAVTNGPWCAQNNKKEWSEDCLYMNIYIPRPLHQVSNTSSLKLPVLVYYHGGNHQVGGANGKDGSFLALHGDVIVVIPNYRLGVFGFLGAVDGDVPGNYGLWDQLQALRWIRGNIGTLGGDPGSVTISGESAGARGVAQLLLYTGEELFHRAICASGPAIGSRGFNFEPKHLNEALVKELNCGPVSNTQAMLDCLRKVPAATLLEKATRAAKTAGLTWWPSPDGKMFKDHPLHLRQSNKVRKVPLMVGTNSHEGYITQQLGQWPFDLSLGINKTVFEENVRASMKKLRYLNRDSPPAFTALALKLYGAGQRVDYSEGLVNFNSDLMFIAGSVYEARLQSKVAKVYYYNLAHKPIKRYEQRLSTSSYAEQPLKHVNAKATFVQSTRTKPFLKTI